MKTLNLNNSVKFKRKSQAFVIKMLGIFSYDARNIRLKCQGVLFEMTEVYHQDDDSSSCPASMGRQILYFTAKMRTTNTDAPPIV